MGNHFKEFIYTPGDAVDLAAKIQKLFSSFEIYKKYCELSSEMAEEFSWEKRAQRFLSFIPKPASEKVG